MSASFAEVNRELEEAVKQIEIKGFELDGATMDRLNAKAAYENEKARYLLESKIRNPDMTVPEIEAMALNLSHDLRLEMIKAESKYRKLNNEVRALRDKLDTYREISFNLRREMQTR